MDRISDQGSRQGLILAAISIGILTVAWITVSGARSAAPVDRAQLRAVTERAVVTNNVITMLPEGFRPGHFTDNDRQTVRGRINQKFMDTYAGTALTNRLNGFLAWADRIATDPTQPRLLSFKLLNLSLDPPTVLDDVATVTGTYSMLLKQGYDTADGITATYGGTYTNAFTLQLEHRGGSAWFVTAFSEQPTGFVRDPSLESNLDVNPAPGETKPPTDDNPPVPVNPAVH
jgi:hypothetical protein